jgi:hypothetical protein
MKRWIIGTTTIGLCLILAILLQARPDTAAQVKVRFPEGLVHGFLVLHTLDGTFLANGDLRQVVKGGEVENRTAFHFKDGSLAEETTVYTQQQFFSMETYRSVQRGPSFPDDMEVLLERSGKYHVKTRAHKNGEEKVLDGTLELPPDISNGLVPILAKNLPKGEGATVHMVVFTPEPKLIEVEIIPAGEQKLIVGEGSKTAIDYDLKPHLGVWLKLFATLTGRVPPDNHLWILADEVPAFIRFEGPFYMQGPIWRVDLTSPRWPNAD